MLIILSSSFYIYCVKSDSWKVGGNWCAFTWIFILSFSTCPLTPQSQSLQPPHVHLHPHPRRLPPNFHLFHDNRPTFDHRVKWWTVIVENEDSHELISLYWLLWFESRLLTCHDSWQVIGLTLSNLSHMWHQGCTLEAVRATKTRAAVKTHGILYWRTMIQEPDVICLFNH